MLAEINPVNYSEPVVLSPHPDPLPKGEGGKLYHYRGF
jgi:hypothetical protein